MAERSRRRFTQPSTPERKSQVQQNKAADQDINRIVARHITGPGRFGMPIGDPNATRQPRFMDVPSSSYHDMLNQVADIQNNFRALPSRTRSMFNNDPYQLLRWVENPHNREEALKRGFVLPETEEEYRMLQHAGIHSSRQRVPDPLQMDLENEAQMAGEGPSQASRPDPEANPRPTPKGGSRPS